jgi:hypothetical protein
MTNQAQAPEVNESKHQDGRATAYETSPGGLLRAGGAGILGAALGYALLLVVELILIPAPIGRNIASNIPEDFLSTIVICTTPVICVIGLPVALIAIIIDDFLRKGGVWPKRFLLGIFGVSAAASFILSLPCQFVIVFLAAF